MFEIELGPLTCQHGNTKNPAESPFCGAPAEMVNLPNGTQGRYCSEHTPVVIARVARRLARAQVTPDAS